LLQCREEGNGSNDSITTVAFFVFLFFYSITKKATGGALLSLFLYVLLQHNKKGDDSKGNIVAIAFFFSCSAAKKMTITLLPSCSSFLSCRAFFSFHFATTKKATTMSRHLLLGFRCSEEEEDNSFCHLLRWLCYKK